MHWVNDEHVFTETLSIAKYCIAIDEDLGSSLRRLIFDSSELCTRPFFGLLHDLMKLGGDTSCYYLVIDPDPRSYFRAHFQKYPLIEINQDDSIDDYLSTLNEDPGGSLADAIGTNWWEYLIFPRTKRWFVRARRDDESNQGGHLYIPTEWNNRITNLYPYARPS